VNSRPKVVICGSYHRDNQGLRRLFNELETTGCRILAPFSVDFESTRPEVVHTRHDGHLEIADMELIHLTAIREADFVMAHIPAGHVGISTAYEIGYASALNKPVFAFTKPDDVMLSAHTTVVRSAYEALSFLPGHQSAARII